MPQRSPTSELNLCVPGLTVALERGFEVNAFGKLSFFSATTALSYFALAAVFNLYCKYLGHDFTEMIFGGFYAYALAPLIGTELTMQFYERLKMRA